MKPQRARIVDALDAAIAQIGLDERPADRPRHSDQPLRGFRRSGGDGRANGLWGAARFSARQIQKASRLIGDIAKVAESAALADDIEQIAMFGRGEVAPTPGSAGAGFRSAKPDEHRPAGRIANVAYCAVAGPAAAHWIGNGGKRPRRHGRGNASIWKS